MEKLVGSTRIAASWIQTNGVDNGIAVISFYGISGANGDLAKRRDNEKLLTALRKHLAHYKDKPTLLCMDANTHMGKSDVLQAITRASWVLTNVERTRGNGRQKVKNNLAMFKVTTQNDVMSTLH